MLEATQEEVAEQIVGLAIGDLTEDQLTNWIEEHLQPLDQEK